MENLSYDLLEKILQSRLCYIFYLKPSINTKPDKKTKNPDTNCHFKYSLLYTCVLFFGKSVK